MTTRKWMQLPTRRLAIDRIFVTQNGVHFHGLENPASVSGDPLPHVLVLNGEFYLMDGHHRLIRTLLDGHRHIEARILEAE